MEVILAQETQEQLILAVVVEVVILTTMGLLEVLVLLLLDT